MSINFFYQTIIYNFFQKYFYMRPSFIYHQVSAIMSIIATILSLIWIITSYRQNDNLFTGNNLYQLSSILLLLSLTWGVHSLIHHSEEVFFGFNPMTGQSAVLDNAPIFKVHQFIDEFIDKHSKNKKN